MNLIHCLLLYSLFVSTHLAPELLNKCKIFNIKDTDCINSSFIPSSEYNKYLQSFNMPVIRDDYCNKNKCMAVVSNETVPPATKEQVAKPQLPVANTMTLTSTTTSTVIISVPKHEAPPLEARQEIKPPPLPAETRQCENTNKESRSEKECEPLKETEEKQTKNKKRKLEKEDISEKEEGNGKRLKEDKNITTVIREIPTTVTVEVPLTLFREHTTTSISRVPIINYSLTTFTERVTSTETLVSTKTTTLTEEVYKTTTVTTEIQKTATITVASEAKSAEIEEKSLDRPKPKPPVSEEEEEPVPKKRPRKKEKEFKFPGHFKEMEEEYLYPKQKEYERKQNEYERKQNEYERKQNEYERKQNEEGIMRGESKLTSTVYVTMSPTPQISITTVTVSVTPPPAPPTPIIPISPTPLKPTPPAQIPPTPPAQIPPTPPAQIPPTQIPSTSQVSKVDQLASILPQKPKEKEDCDEDIIPLLKELLKSTIATKKGISAKPKKSSRKVYRTVYAKKRKRKCIPKTVCEEKKCIPAQYDRICEDDNDI